MIDTKGCGAGGNGKILVQGYKFLVIRVKSSGDFMYGVVIIANNNTVLHT